jgi:hypothetical protein
MKKDKIFYTNGNARSQVLAWKEGVVSRRLGVAETTVFDFNAMGKIRAKRSNELLWKVALQPGYFFPNGKKTAYFESVSDACTVMDEIIRADWVNRILMEENPDLDLAGSEAKIALMLKRFAPPSETQVSETFVTSVLARARNAAQLLAV